MLTSTMTSTQEVQPKFSREDIRRKGVPEKVPSIIELKRIVPSHCFTPNLATSFYYVLKDLLIVAALYAVMVATELQPFPAVR